MPSMQGSGLKTSRAAAFGLRGIARYRQVRPVASRGCCLYAETCSHYAERLLHERCLPVALWLIAVRLLSCRRRFVWVPRPGSLRAVLALSAIVTLGTAGLAQAVKPAFYDTRATQTQGGCTMTLNGRDIGDYNRNNPLQVNTGTRLIVNGLAPQKVRNAPEHINGYTYIKIEVSLPGRSPSLSSDPHKGTRSFQSLENVDEYLKYGSGLYRVHGTATGLNPNKVFECAATFYVKLNGNDAAGLIGGAVAIAGLAGAATSGGKTDWQTGDVVPNEEKVSAEGGVTDVANDARRELVPDPKANRQDALATMGCLGLIIFVMFNNDAIVGAAMARGIRPSAEGVRRRGHPVRGFMCGLLAGLGATVFMHQQGYWLLTWLTAFGLPLALAVLFAVRGWRGKAFRWETPAGAAPPGAAAS